MAMWAGVQKLSRPMERCQETSQCAPMVTEVTASAAHQRYHGMRTTLLVRVFAVRVAMLRFPPLPDEDRIQRDADAGVAPYRKRGRGWVDGIGARRGTADPSASLLFGPLRSG